MEWVNDPDDAAAVSNRKCAIVDMLLQVVLTFIRKECPVSAAQWTPYPNDFGRVWHHHKGTGPCR
jgi:hypothetical protein